MSNALAHGSDETTLLINTNLTTFTEKEKKSNFGLEYGRFATAN